MIGAIASPPCGREGRQRRPLFLTLVMPRGSGSPRRRKVPIRSEGIANLSNNRDYNHLTGRVNANRTPPVALTRLDTGTSSCLREHRLQWSTFSPSAAFSPGVPFRGTAPLWFFCALSLLLSDRPASPVASIPAACPISALRTGGVGAVIPGRSSGPPGQPGRCR